jgi:endonuclease YncB( thermonuclease family)
MKRLALLLTIFITIGACSSSSVTPDYVGTVTWVIDGDTIIVNDVHVRLLSIDTPELNEPGGSQAASFMIDLLYGQDVLLFCDGWDRYDRLLCDVHLNGHDVGDILVDEGLARVWR